MPDALLIGKVVFGALGLVGGLYSFTYAFRKSRNLHSDAGAFYVLFGVGGMLFGAMNCLQALFGM